MKIHRRGIVVLLGGLLFLTAACLSVPVPPEMVQPAAVTVQASATPVPSFTASLPLPTQTATASPSPSPTATLALPVRLGTPLPEMGEVIRADRLERLVEVAGYGRGKVLDLAYSADGQHLAVATTQGLDVLEAGTLADVCRFYAPSSGESGENAYAVFRTESKVVLVTPDGYARVVSLPGCGLEEELDVATSAGLRGEGGEPNMAFQALAADGSAVYFSPVNSSGKNTDFSNSLYRASLTGDENVEKIAYLGSKTRFQKVYLSADQSLVVFYWYNKGNFYDLVTQTESGVTARRTLVQADLFGLSDDGMRMVSYRYIREGFPDTTVSDPWTGSLITNFSFPYETEGFTFSPDNAILAIRTNFGAVLMDIASTKEIVSLDTGNSSVDTLRFSPDGAAIALAGPAGLALWDWSINQRLAQRRDYAAWTNLTFSQSTGRLGASVEGSASVIEMHSGTILGTIVGQDLAAIHSDGSVLVTADGSYGLALWSLPGFTQTAAADVHSQILALHPNRLAVAIGGYARLVREFTFDGLQESGVFPESVNAYGLVYSPDGDRLAILGPSGLGIYGASDFLRRFQIPFTTRAGRQELQGLPAFTSDGEIAWMAVFGEGANEKHSIYMYSVNRQTRVGEITTPAEDVKIVLPLAFNAESGLLVSGGLRSGQPPGSRDLLLLWDWETRLAVAQLPLPGPLSSLLFSQDGTRLLLTTTDGVVYVWGIDPRSGD